MTEKTKKMLDFLRSKEYRAQREDLTIDITDMCKGLDYDKIQPIILREALSHEKYTIYDNDLFGFNKSYKGYPVNQNPKVRSWQPNNITVNYGKIIKEGFDKTLEKISCLKKDANSDQLEFYGIIEEEIGYIYDFCNGYREKAQSMNNMLLANALQRIPHKGATTLYEACLFQKIIIFVLRATKHNHITLGRFDQYMYEYYQNDVKTGKSREELLELIELYFISLNIDTDTYFGIQQGDNGQSMVLGGFDLDGNDMFNELSYLCMEASLELEVIDPKINLRVSKKTTDEMYEYATKLTKKGLGFPQYCNDDVVVPGLVALGYDPKDAVEYTVAACWEFIVPGKSHDIPNIQTFNFPKIVGAAISEQLENSDSFDDLMEHVDRYIANEAKRIMDLCSSKGTFAGGVPVKKSPLMSMFVDGCIEKGKDIADFGAKYNNLGCHGAGISNAADALAAVKKVIYDEGSVSKRELLNALENNFDNNAELRNKLLSCPKVGNDDDYADSIMIHIMSVFSRELNGKPNGCGGVWRAGTGSAMEYILSARMCPATADGRYAAAPYGSSFSPSVTARLNGPLSVIKSFTKPDLTQTINGGPLTMEVNHNVFRNEEGEKKIAALVKLFVKLGGHQLQLNSISKETLIEAQKCPKDYPNLIVRVWGWSGYFCELEKVYQDHIISRTDFSV